jgi:hypothetical protein
MGAELTGVAVLNVGRGLAPERVLDERRSNLDMAILNSYF